MFINLRRLKLLFLAALFLTPFLRLEGYPQQGNAQRTNEDNTQSNNVSSEIRFKVSNHEAEISALQEKFSNLENAIESLRNHQTETESTQRDQLKGGTASFEARIVDLETSLKTALDDLRKLHTHSNETTTALTQYKKKIGELEKMLQSQNQNIESLQTAMRSLTQAFQPTVASTEKIIKDTIEGNSYRVKSGDSLEKIASKNGTSIKILKELNNLANDRINVGQVLRLP